VSCDHFAKDYQHVYGPDNYMECGMCGEELQADEMED
jgi:hypothetical protein